MTEESKKKRIVSETSTYDPSTKVTTHTIVYSDGSVKTTVNERHSLSASKIDRRHERIEDTDEDEVNNQ